MSGQSCTRSFAEPGDDVDDAFGNSSIEVLAEGKRRGIEIIAAPTLEVCQLLEEVKKGQAYAILHCTC
jgi:hypothetical protein